MGWAIFIFTIIILFTINIVNDQKKSDKRTVDNKNTEKIQENSIFILKKFIKEYIEGEKNFTLPFSVIDYWIDYFGKMNCKSENISGKQWFYSDSYIQNPHIIFAIIRNTHICNAFYSLNYFKKLAIKRNQLVTEDEYDDFLDNEDEWFKELNKFLKSKYDMIYPYLLVDNLYIQYAKSINKEHLLVPPDNVEDVLKLNEDSNIYFDSIAQCFRFAEELFPEYFINNHELYGKNAPIIYEGMIEQIFATYGWNARRTSTTGDQGADVIAEKNDITVVVQCKYYSNSVGNKSVQEVAAARGFYKAQIALVVTNSFFTSSAIKLAHSLNVTLLHHNNLSDFIESL